MPKWIAEQLWKDETVYIVGGGTSLESFDFDLLKDKKVVGCNDAYLLGENIIDICVFGDLKWFDIHKEKVKNFKNPIHTNVPELYINMPDIPNLFVSKRINNGLGISALAWNQNTGCLAVNLALLLGAKKIYLLGFDMKLGKQGNANWHENLVESPNAEVYGNFQNGFLNLERFRKSLFPNTEIININDDSDLTVFPTISAKLFWKKELKNKQTEKLDNGENDYNISNVDN